MLKRSTENMNNQPLVSIVIANYNYGRFLEDAIQSVLNQSCQDFELIICDAASTDNSVDVIKKYAEGLPPNTQQITAYQQQTQKISWWCSEKDGGQSAAFNKGFSHARGRFLTWLNADDVMLPEVIEKLKYAAEKFPNCEWFVGGCFWLDSDLRILNCGRGRTFSKLRFDMGDISVWGPSSFFTRRLLSVVGGVDERFHFAMDIDLWNRFVHNSNVRYRPFCNYAWGLRLHQDSKMSGHNFNADGKFDTKHSEQERIAKSRNYKQIMLERNWLNERGRFKKKSYWKWWVSVRWWQVLMAKIDLLRLKGKSYLEEYYK